MRFTQRFFRKLLVVLPVILALAFVVFLVRSRSAPAKKKQKKLLVRCV